MTRLFNHSRRRSITMMGRGSYPHNPTFKCIASRPRRAILLALRTWGFSSTEQRLAAYLGAPRVWAPRFETTETETVRAELRYIHLPALEEADLVTWRQKTEHVEPTAHPAFDDPRFKQLLDLQTDGLDEVLSALAHDYRRIILTVLEGEAASMSRSELGRELRRRVPAPAEHAVPAVETVTTTLHHVHLPKLDDLGLIDFDPERGRTTYVGHPALDEVFTIIYGRDESTTEKLDGFLDGLADAYQQASDGTNTMREWPHFWRVPCNV